jgi:hypothetical protein
MKNNVKKDQGCDRATQDNLQEEHQKGDAGNGRGTDRKETKGKESETGGVGERKRRRGTELGCLKGVLLYDLPRLVRLIHSLLGLTGCALVAMAIHPLFCH